MPLRDALVVSGIALASSGVVALVGVLVLVRLRTRSVGSLLLLVPVVCLTAVVAGAIATCRAMFLSMHDLRVLSVVVVVAAAVGLAAAAALSRFLLSGVGVLTAGLSGLGKMRHDDEQPYPGAQVPLPRELAVLDQALVAADARLRQSRQREQAMERSRRELVAWVSHDLRTPLAGIRAMAEALEDSVVADSATVARYHQGIRVEADRLAGMVDDLFELSTINAQALRLSWQRVELAEVVSDAVASAAPLAAAKGVRLVGEAAGDLPTVRASVPELGRALRNVLSNAIRHTPADGTVSVRARASDGEAWVEVLDGCGGIPEDDLPRVFDVAFRGTAARTPGDDGGAGLGLSIARGLVHAHHGEITIANTGPGCQVSVRLPVPA